ncbi:alpha/beta hydrolase [Occallatibacter savannae]|uniref:alpha/beta hydrolase n=1 Tax=Occallatibacter savannae TaxID=1002691 RepID=UPI0013A5829B|nr:alpha/beta hydrolase family protein [Occallatibacter savannae]
MTLVCSCRSARQSPEGHPHRFAGVRLEDVSFHSAGLERDVTYRVYLPAQLAGGKLPVIYLLHGAWENYRTWSDYSQAGALAANGAILVMPDGVLSYWVNEAGAPKDRYGDFLLHDLRADVEARFPARTDRAVRAIVGVSMGGFAAIEYALTRPDLFAFAGALSPALDAPERKFSWRRFGQSIRLRRVFGADGSAQRRDEDPFVLVTRADPATTPYIYITAGDQEALLGSVRRFAAQMERRGFAFEFHTSHGGHNWGTWNQQTAACFDALESRLPVRGI